MIIHTQISFRLDQWFYLVPAPSPLSRVNGIDRAKGPFWEHSVLQWSSSSDGWWSTHGEQPQQGLASPLPYITIHLVQVRNRIWWCPVSWSGWSHRKSMPLDRCVFTCHIPISTSIIQISLVSAAAPTTMPVYFLRCTTDGKAACAEWKIAYPNSPGPFFTPTPLNPGPWMRLIMHIVNFISPVIPLYHHDTPQGENSLMVVLSAQRRHTHTIPLARQQKGKCGGLHNGINCRCSLIGWEGGYHKHCG